MLFSCLQGTKIIDESQDQDTTDLHKCISYVNDLTPDIDKSKVSCTSGYTFFIFHILWELEDFSVVNSKCNIAIIEMS